MNTEEEQRLEDISKPWKKWGPYLSDRQWGTVREDYSADGDAWNYLTHDMARSKAYRWGEEGIGGLSDETQILCFSLALWNGKDPILKERYFGLNGSEGNHGEDVKEYYYYLDNTPTHSYMKMLYKYSQEMFPYSQLIQENRRRSKLEAEYELIDTGVFDENRYFDVFIEYAKVSPEDILINITAFNRGRQESELHLVPQIWFRNTWAWGYDSYKPILKSEVQKCIFIEHKDLGNYFLYYEGQPGLLFCENETNLRKLYGVSNTSGYFKDGINDYLVNSDGTAISNEKQGTKVGVQYKLSIAPGKSSSIHLRLSNQVANKPFEDFDKIFQNRKKEADTFYSKVQSTTQSEDEKLVQRQAFAGMLWSKQFFYYDIPQWLNGDPTQIKPPKERLERRNSSWVHLNNADIISMPDKWEYPWYAAWDLAFHCIPLAMIDPSFAKEQLILLGREWYMHPNGQMPAYEWNFSDVNPPVHAWASFRVYDIDKKLNNGMGDTDFLEKVFHKLLLNFTWWVNRKDEHNHNIFQGGFLGLDNIGVFDRSSELPTGGHIEQADGTAWMAMFSLNMLRISLELSMKNHVYEDMATKFLEHFLYIAGAMINMGGEGIQLWDEEDEFYYDVLHTKNGCNRLKVRSMVGLIPLFAVEVIKPEILDSCPEFAKRMKWFLNYRPDLANLVSRWQEEGKEETHLFSLLRGHRLKKILHRMLDETEFLSDYGIRALSKYHQENPYIFRTSGEEFVVNYQPGESESFLFGGNSNWRGPIWFPVNFLIVESLYQFYAYYGDDFRVEYPTHSQKYFSLKEIAEELTKKLSKIFLKKSNGNRPVFNQSQKMQTDPHFRDYLQFYEYFHGDNGRGVGASHQTGWTGLIAKLLNRVEL